MVRVHVGLDLEHKTGKFIVGWLNDLVITSLMSSGFGRILQIRLQERFDPEIGEGGPKKYWRHVSRHYFSFVKIITSFVDQFDFIQRVTINTVLGQFITRIKLTVLV